MNKVSIVIPNWNGKEKLQNNLPAVLKVKDATEVIVVDDASTDDSIDFLKSYPQVKLIKKEKNTGFSSTVNLGVENSIGDIVVLLNSDASPSPDFLEYLLPHFNNPKVFAAGCNTGGSFAKAKFESGFFWHNQSMEKVKNSHLTLWVSGGSGAFRKSIWEKLGGLDTLFDPFYEEDLDIGYRAYKRGYINMFEPESVVTHYHDKGVIAQNFSKSTISKIAQRNQLIFIWKNITSQKLFLCHLKALLYKLLSHPKYWLVFWESFKRLPQIQAKRAIEKAQSKLTDEEVLAMFAS